MGLMRINFLAQLPMMITDSHVYSYVTESQTLFTLCRRYYQKHSFVHSGIYAVS